MSINRLLRKQVYKDPIHGYINVSYEIIKKLINTSVFQRLRRIKQLSAVYLVFHGAEHSRFGHSLGTYEMANLFLEQPDIMKNLTQREGLLFLVSALLHDIGHGPFSHSFEESLGIKHEIVSARLVLENTEIKTILDEVDNDFAWDTSKVIKGEYPNKVILSLISSKLDADRLDYISRDGFYTGTAYGHIDFERIIRAVRIINNEICYKENAIHAIENYLLSRYHMYWQVYFHDVSRCFEIILKKIYSRIIQLLQQGIPILLVDNLTEFLKNKDKLDQFLKLDDDYIISIINNAREHDDFILASLCRDFINRNKWIAIDITDYSKTKVKEITSNLRVEFYEIIEIEQNIYNNYKIYEQNEIYILKNGSLEPIYNVSKVVKGLLTTQNKIIKKLYYKPNASN